MSPKLYSKKIKKKKAIGMKRNYQIKKLQGSRTFSILKRNIEIILIIHFFFLWQPGQCF